MTCPEILPTHPPFKYVNFSACINTTSSSGTYNNNNYLYAAIGIKNPMNFPESCNITVQYPMKNISEFDHRNLSITNLHHNLLLGFTLEFCSSKSCYGATTLVDYLTGYVTTVYTYYYYNLFKTSITIPSSWDIEVINIIFSAQLFFFLIINYVKIKCDS